MDSATTQGNDDLPPVIEHVQDEGVDAANPATILPDDAQQIAHERWASWVEHRVQGLDATSEPESSETFALVLTFNRHPQCFDTALHRSAIGQRIAEQAQVQPLWASGAKVLVPGLDEDAWHAAGTGINLSSYHVIVRPDDLHEVERVLGGLCSRGRPRRKPGVPDVAVTLPDRAVLFQDISDDGASPCEPPLSAEYGVPCHDETSISSAGSIDIVAEQAWLEAVRHAVTNARRIHINVRNTFVEVAESASMPSMQSRHTV